ncbi:MFS transporter [Rubrivirga sp. S365]|uniref:MFS transporter n=1 Tax=Rubrivirga litoralis TaxID=3075598 RepID=A0ABU3BVF4_9BACT|nr:MULTISPECIES: MFS transporter [unclassified Rubrivirga]MDT0633262.1 MFS transporter [Rubrivirga sp. F394]MDT7856880.1 MFS transporter [Rubrivirga sp. S365]
MAETTAPPASTSRTVWAWALYDFANSAFTTLVVTFIYATYFTQGIAANETDGTAQWSLAVTVTAVLVAVLSPLLGAYADATGTRKRLLFVTTALCIAATAVLFFPERGDVAFALGVFVVANVAFELQNVFYNAFLPEIAPPDRIGRVSGLGWALGYVGGLLCMGVALVVFVQPDVAPFGLDKATGANVRATNLLVAAWFALFSVPAFLTLRDPRPEAPPERRGLLRSTLGEIADTAREIRQYRQIIRLLVARLVYNDGLVTVFAFGGIYAAGTFGFTFEEILFFGIALNLAAGAGAFVFGFVDDRIGGKTTILISLGALTVATLVAVLGQTPEALWAAGILLGIAAGPNQAASRSLLGRFVPGDKETEFYGFFAFSGKLTAFMGPLLLGQLTVAFDSQRIGVGSVVVFFVIGALLLLRVDEAEGVRLSGRAPA